MRQQGAKQYGGMNGGRAGEIADLMATGKAGCNHDGVSASAAKGREQATLTDLS
jgi:hypothetical protein